MDVREYKRCPVLVLSKELGKDNAHARALEDIMQALENIDFRVISTNNEEEAVSLYRANPDAGAIVIEWDVKKNEDKLIKALKQLRKRNRKVPVFLVTKRIDIKEIPADIVRETKGYIWLMEDTADFIAGRIEDAARDYFNEFLPPFFNELAKYVDDYKYAWHTPGHMGGVAFRKTASGKFFYDFFGENIFRADLSVSVPELGSLLEHSGVVGDAEANAAHAFGADRTYFVTNGTSTANKVVFCGAVTHGDVVLVDRNCHKSAMHAIQMTGVIPVYFIPERNAYGIIGPIHNTEFEPATVRKKIKNCPLIKDKKRKAKLAIVTNSTYDGLCYNVEMVKKKLKDEVDMIHFDEAWYGYAKFHKMYEKRYAMFPHKDAEHYPTMFATQSTHKVLAAFSQASMVHVKNGKVKIEHDRFNEAYMMHTSTSPEYEIIASLDIATRMMQEDNTILDDAMEEAIIFRKKMVQLNKQIKGWWFGVWQPDIMGKADEALRSNSNFWTLKSNDKWHGFGNLEKDHVLLDPIKVTVLTPGIKESGKMMDWGIPAAIASKFLQKKGVVVEKTGHYSFLLLFTIGVTKGKSGTLLNALFELKRTYDEDLPVKEVFPDLVEKNPERYGSMKFRELCKEMHEFFIDEKITQILEEVYSVLPEPKMVPSEAFSKLITGKVKKVEVKKVKGKISAAMVVPYPPGIPVVMPGEEFGPKTQRILDYLAYCEDFDTRFPGFENEVHGVMVENGKYYIYCIS